jgi:hypothetical protein
LPRPRSITAWRCRQTFEISSTPSRVHQRPAFSLVQQGLVVADLGNRQFVPQVAGRMLKDALHLAAVHDGIEVGVD